MLHCLVYDKKGFSESLLLWFDAESGDEICRFTDSHVLHEPVVNSRGEIFVSSFSGIVRAFECDGTQKWASRILDGPHCNLGCVEVVGQDWLVVAETHGQARNTWCLSQATGDVLWQFENGGHTLRLASNGAVVVHCTVVRSMNEVSVRTFALDVRSGRMLWCADSRDWMFAAQIIDNLVLVGGRGRLRAHELCSGNRIADHPIADAMEIETRWVQRNLTSIFACSGASSLEAVEVLAETKAWQGSAFRRLWRIDLGYPISGQPVDRGGQGYAMLENGRLQEFDFATGLLGSAHKLAKRASTFAIGGKNVAVAHGRDLAVWELQGSSEL